MKPRRHSPLLLLRVLIAVALLSRFGAAAAEEFAGFLGVGLVRSDNIRLSSNNPQSETVGLATTDFFLRSIGPRLQLDTAASLEFQKYSSDTYSNQMVGNLAASGKYALIKDRLNFVVQENFGQQQIQANQVNTPDNRERINYLSVGPDVIVPLTEQTSLKASGRFSEVSYQTSDLGNQRVTEEAVLSRRLSLQNIVSVNVSNEQVRYDNSVDNRDFSRRAAFARFTHISQRTTIDFDLGVNRVSGLGSAVNDPLWRVSLARQLTPASRLTFVTGQEISDAGNLLRQRQSFTGGNLDPQLLQSSSDPISNRYSRIEFDFSRNRTKFSLDLGRYRDEHKVLSDLDRTLTQVNGRLGRNLAPNLSIIFADEYIKESFASPLTPGYRQNTVAGTVVWKAGRRLEFRLQYAHANRTGEGGAAGYSENRVTATVGARVGDTNADIRSVSHSVF